MFQKNYKKALRADIIARIDFAGYTDGAGNPLNHQTDDEKIIALIDIARSEYGHEFTRHGLLDGLSGWLSGLPTCIDLPVYNGEIVEFAEKIGSVVNPTDKEAEKICNNFYRFMAANILQMHSAAMRRRAKLS